MSNFKRLAEGLRVTVMRQEGEINKLQSDYSNYAKQMTSDIEALERQIEGCNCYENAEIDDIEFNDQEMEIRALERQIEKNEGYFRCICEALNINHKSSLTEILVAIDNLLKDGSHNA